jgi:hypothetical protein
VGVGVVVVVVGGILIINDDANSLAYLLQP